MSYAFTPEVQQLVAQHMAGGQFQSEDELLLAALTALAERESATLIEDPVVIAGVRRGLAEMHAGLGRSLEEFDAEFRAKHGISSDA